MSDAPRRSEREDLPGGWLPPSDASPDRDAFGRPWEERSADTTDRPVAPASWPGAAATTRRAPGAHPASFGARAQAAVVDFFVRLALVLAGSLAGAPLFLAGETAGVVGLVAGIGLGFVAGLAYAPLMMSRTGGQTIGHKASGTRIVSRDGTPVTGGQAALREVVVKWLVFDAVGGTLFLPTLLNYLWPLWDEQNEALHDKLCRTRVVDA